MSKKFVKNILNITKANLLGAEQNFGMYSFDDLYYFLKYPVKNNRFKYLNAGTMMGPVNKGIQLLETLGVTNEKQASDQM